MPRHREIVDKLTGIVEGPARWRFLGNEIQRLIMEGRDRLHIIEQCKMMNYSFRPSLSDRTLDRVMDKWLNMNLWRQKVPHKMKGRDRVVNPNSVTVEYIFREHPLWVGVLGWDENRGCMVMLKQAPFLTPAEKQSFQSRNWSDTDSSRAWTWLERIGVGATLPTTKAKLKDVAELNRFHPIKDYLNSLLWDGVERIGHIENYATIEGDQDLTLCQAMFGKWIIGAATRMLKPGSKLDTMIIFQGKQGIRKSSFFEALAGKDWFTDRLGKDLNDPDTIRQIQGKWLIEWADLEGFGAKEVEEIKAFLSRTTDRHTPKWCEFAVDLPRQCAFAGTSNNDAMLRDRTGNRRFWPIRVEAINIDAVRQDRDLIWAEAVECVKNNEPWWFLEEDPLKASLDMAQKEATVHDPWVDTLGDWLAVSPRAEIEPKEAMGALGIHSPTPLEFQRVSACLRELGWRQIRKREGERRLRVWTQNSMDHC